jgi:hypothetical protein
MNNTRQVAALHRRKLVALQASLLTAVLVIAVIVPAAADHVGGHETYPSTPQANDAGYWEDFGADLGEDDWVCEKDDAGADVPYVLGDPDEGYVWRLLVVKAGADWNDLYWDPVAGGSYAATGQGAGAWSHVIHCQRPADDDDELELELEKVWTVGSDPQGLFDEADVSENLTINGNAYTGPITVEDGDELTIDEDVTGLPEDCWFSSDPAMPYDYTVDEDDAVDGMITITITNTVNCEEDEEAENGTTTTTTTATVDIELVKLWFDADGNEVDQPGGDWAVTLTEHRDGEDIDRATLQGDTTSAVRSLVEGRGYTVTESGLPGGWGEVDGCEALSVPAGTVAIGTGTFSADEAGLHVVCNQAEVEVLAEVLEEEVEVLDELPRTGLPATLLTLFGLLGIALGGGLLGRSRS